MTAPSVETLSQYPALRQLLDEYTEVAARLRVAHTNRTRFEEIRLPLILKEIEALDAKLNAERKVRYALMDQLDKLREVLEANSDFQSLATLSCPYKIGDIVEGQGNRAGRLFTIFEIRSEVKHGLWFPFDLSRLAWVAYGSWTSDVPDVPDDIWTLSGPLLPEEAGS